LFFLVEYVPVTEEKEYMALDKIQRIILLQHIKNFRKIHPAIFIGFPGDEEQYGGCLAAGRGFVHVSSDGFLEPCPFAPFSDSDLKKLSLKEALSSEMLKDIRGNHGFLSESAGGCALWANREWVKSLQNRHHSHNLDEP
jgi:MoaA/NifB/PqqE/SkfB family radical SAM enzyme